MKKDLETTISEFLSNLSSCVEDEKKESYQKGKTENYPEYHYRNGYDKGYFNGLENGRKENLYLEDLSLGQFNSLEEALKIISNSPFLKHKFVELLKDQFGNKLY